MQTAESIMPPQLAIINGQLADVFGEKYNSLFVSTTPSDYFFNGIPICVDPSGIAKIICSVIKSQHSPTMREMDDGSLKFSLFSYVRILQ